jgi:hypothetical protein
MKGKKGMGGKSAHSMERCLAENLLKADYQKRGD